jgi:agmatinase
MSNFTHFIGCEAPYEKSKIVIFGVPFDGTTSYRPGTRFAPTAIRNESYGIETYSPYCDKDLEDFSICDMGDLELPFGNSEKVITEITNFTENLLNDNKFPLMLGGEHLVTLGTIIPLAKKYPNLNIIHFDAHADLREEYLGENLSHASVIRRCFDILKQDNSIPNIHQFGIRSGTKEEFLFAEKYTNMHKFNCDGLNKTLETLENIPQTDVYLTIDLDVLDPAYMCGTGTPEAGGVTFPELLNAVEKICNAHHSKKINLIGADIVELSPSYDPSGASTALACKLLRELILNVV